jgi:hypothetical protein
MIHNFDPTVPARGKEVPVRCSFLVHQQRPQVVILAALESNTRPYLEPQQPLVNRVPVIPDRVSEGRLAKLLTVDHPNDPAVSARDRELGD